MSYNKNTINMSFLDGIKEVADAENWVQTARNNLGISK
jgi:hypothetical protein